jgi:hypothetical protein
MNKTGTSKRNRVVERRRLTGSLEVTAGSACLLLLADTERALLFRYLKSFIRQAF